MLLPLAVLFTADNVQIFTVTLDLSLQACKNARLSLASVVWYVLLLHACSVESAITSCTTVVPAPVSAEIVQEALYTVLA